MFSSRLNSVSPLGISKTSYPNKERTARIKTSQGANCDSVSISSPSNRENRFYLELVNSMSREVRTATSASDIRALREQVASGQYTPDPARIAASMLFLGENL